MGVRVAAAVAAAVLLLGVAGFGAAAGPVEDGEAAYERGDYAGALHIWVPLAERGDPRAENWLGLLYHNGAGVTQDDVTAAKWYRHAAQQGYAVAQFNLAVEYIEGTGVARDEAEAAQWFGKAARGGYVPAERELGSMYYRGRGGLAQNAAEAAKWWRAAAAGGDVEAVKLLQEAEAGEAAQRAEAARAAAIRKAELPAELKRNRAVNYWRVWNGGCFDYVAAEDFVEPAPRPSIKPRRNCCPGVATIKNVVKNVDGVDDLYLVAFAAKPDQYCPIQFFGGWIKASVLVEK